MLSPVDHQRKCKDGLVGINHVPPQLVHVCLAAVESGIGGKGKIEVALHCLQHGAIPRSERVGKGA
jgi:hypothetical protein